MWSADKHPDEWCWPEDIRVTLPEKGGHLHERIGEKPVWLSGFTDHGPYEHPILVARRFGSQNWVTSVPFVQTALCIDNRSDKLFKAVFRRDLWYAIRAHDDRDKPTFFHIMVERRDFEDFRAAGRKALRCWSIKSRLNRWIPRPEGRHA